MEMPQRTNGSMNSFWPLLYYTEWYAGLSMSEFIGVIKTPLRRFWL